MGQLGGQRPWRDWSQSSEKKLWEVILAVRRGLVRSCVLEGGYELGRCEQPHLSAFPGTSAARLHDQRRNN